MKNNDIILKEAGKLCKIFSEQEAKLIREGKLDVTQFFENKEESTQRLMAALRGRPVYPGEKERMEILKRGKELRDEIKAFKKDNKIEDPPEHKSKKAGEVS